MRTCSVIIILILIAGISNSQSLHLPAADLKSAQKIEVNQTYNFIQGPKGYGKLQEFRINPKKSPYIFKEERNSAWFIIDIPYRGTLTFDLSPHDANDDYDWMLFKSVPDLDKLIINDLARPLRSNNARNNKSSLSKTGLNANSRTPFIKPGPGNNYSVPLEAEAGTALYLVVDNIYGGKGFDLSLNLSQNFGSRTVLLEGTVRDKYSLKNLSADVIVEDDSTGVLISKVKSDPLTGQYKLRVPADRPLNATAWHSNYLFASQVVSVNQNTRVNFELDTIASGKKLVLFNIHFLANKDQILPSSFSEMERLITFLNEQPQLNIKIVGHTNNNVFAPERYLQKLSFDRALAVKKYLLEHSISSKRISCAGLGGKEPLIVTKDSREGMKNLRVEVILVRK